MDHAELRMHCLKLAVELGPQVGATLAAADQLLSFLTATGNSVPVVSEETTADAALLLVETTEPASVDPIAACGTALAIPEGGDLADAAPLQEAATADVTASEEPTQATVEVVAETADAEVIQAEAAASDEAPTVTEAANTNDEVVGAEPEAVVAAAAADTATVAVAEPEVTQSA